MYGFPFGSGVDIRSSPAVADVDNDGSNEVVFGTIDGRIYILSTFGITFPNPVFAQIIY